MDDARFSQTALRVAMRRAAHQVFDRPLVLDDPLALRIIGDTCAREIRGVTSEDPFSRAARAFMAVRARIAEDALADFVGLGIRQYVVLGAGLDTFAYRHAYEPTALRVFEVDHPATQAWKRQCLATAGIAAPSSVTYAPIDFERQTLREGLEAVGFETTAPAFISWLGVSMYLSADAVERTLAFAGHLPSPSGIAFDYAVPRASLRMPERFVLDLLSVRVAAAGEPFTSFFDPADIASRLQSAGLDVVLDLGRDDMNARYLAGRADGLVVRGELGRVVVARTHARQG